MTRPSTFFYDGQLVRVTPEHERVAKLIFERRPYFYHQPTGRPAEWGKVDWERAPAWYALEMFELAHAIISGPPVVEPQTPKPKPPEFPGPSER